jgi:VWFA-related protein
MGRDHTYVRCICPPEGARPGQADNIVGWIYLALLAGRFPQRAGKDSCQRAAESARRRGLFAPHFGAHCGMDRCCNSDDLATRPPHDCRIAPQAGPENVRLNNPVFIMRRLSLFLLVLCCFGAITILAGQQPASPAETSSAPSTLRVTAHLVQLNVVVIDKRGNAMTGLPQQLFTILDNGKPQAIHVFAAETNLPSGPPVAALPSDIYTNRPEEQTNIPASVTVILFDALNTEAPDQTLARKQVIRVLQEIQPQEYVALYWLGNGLSVLHDFTTDASALRAVLAGYESKSGVQLDNSVLDDPSLHTPNPSASGGQTSQREAFRQAFDQRVANQSTRERVRATAAALIAISNHLGTRKGRKNLVWISSSFPISLGYDKFDLNWASETGEDFAAEVQKAVRALSSADIAVYPVDARGLLGSNMSANDDTLEAHIGDPTDTDAKLPSRAVPQTLDTMRALAERTGGKAFYGTNDISGAVRRAMNDARATYTLGYYPADTTKWDGSFHEVKVKVAAPGAEVRVRSGYFALPSVSEPSSQNNRALFAQLAASHLPATAIGLHVRVKSATAADAMLTAEVQIDVREIQMHQNGGRRTGALQSVFLQLDNLGHVLKADDQTFHLDFDAATYGHVLRTGISDTRQVRVVPNASQLCVIVRDSGANIGSIYVPLQQFPANTSMPSRPKP